MLGPFILNLHHNPGWNMCNTNSGFCFIHVLSASPLAVYVAPPRCVVPPLASAAALEIDDDFRVPLIENAPQEQAADLLDIVDIRNSLKSLMWQGVGRCF